MNTQDIFKIVEAFGRATEVTKFKADIIKEKNTQWGKLWDFAVSTLTTGQIRTGDDFASILYPGEDQYMNVYFKDDPKSKWEHDTPKHKKGDWKMSLLPREYTTSRDLIKRAINNGELLRLNDDKKTGKSAVQAAMPRKNKPRDVAENLNKLALQANKLHQFASQDEWKQFLGKLAP